MQKRGASPSQNIYPLPFTNPLREGGQGDRSQIGDKPKMPRGWVGKDAHGEWREGGEKTKKPAI